jgi:hypothetical protein
MERGVGTPRAPSLRARDKFGGARPLSSAVGERAHEADIAGGEGVRLAQRAHGDVTRGPLADPGQGDEAPDTGLEALAGGEEPGVGAARCRHRR